jgi:integrase/recombinase XerC
MPAQMSLDAGVIAKHIEWMRVRELSALTVKNRRCVLANLSRYLGGEPLLYATQADLEAWQAKRAGVIAPASRRNDVSHVRAFFAWVVIHERLRSDDPAATLNFPRAPRRYPRPISEAKFLAALTGAPDEATAAILALAGFAGLRAVEIARLDWAEIDVAQSPAMLYVARGKGERSRVVPLSPRLVALLETLPYRRGPVIRRLDGAYGYASPNAITKRANRHLHLLGITETLHQLRHRFATAGYAKVRDIRATQELLGHASPTTTAIYTAPHDGALYACVLAASEIAA